jgi:hypothetical protein
MDVGELRYGERKEMLIELNLDNQDMQHAELEARALTMVRKGQMRQLKATDQSVRSAGLEALSIDEVPVIEVKGSFYDPSTSKQVSRLTQPVPLIVTLLPTPTGSS